MGYQTWLKKIQKAQLGRQAIAQWGPRLFKKIIKSYGPLSQKNENKKLCLKFPGLMDSLQIIRGFISMECEFCISKIKSRRL